MVEHVRRQNSPELWSAGVRDRLVYRHVLATDPGAAQRVGVQGGTQRGRHHLIRRGATYGPRLAPGVLEDDGADRSLIFVAVNANITRQFEFAQAQWLNDASSSAAPTRPTRW